MHALVIPTLLLLASLISAPAQAGELGGVPMPDTCTVGEHSLQLNGMGLREAFGFIDVYVGALYLPSPDSDPDSVIRSDLPKRMVMHFIYKRVPRQDLIDTFAERIAENPDALQVEERMQRLYAVMEDMASGDEVVIDYLPGTGTSFSIKGQHKLTLEGADLMRAIWSMFVGPNPPSKNFKRGLLGG